MNDLMIRGAAEIATPVGKSALHGAAMGKIRVLKGASVVIRGGKIEAVGPAAEIDRAYASARLPVIDASGKSIVPGFVDSHTHFLFGGYREDEFLMRLAHKSYLEIMRAGGGIVNTVRETRRMTEDDLCRLGLERLRAMLAQGITTVEGKSGYGLDLDTELKMLRVMKRLAAAQPAALISTFLGAHAVPEEYKGRGDDYIDFLIGTVLPAVGREKLAEYCDVFCEEGVFSVAQSEKLLRAAQSLGFGCKVHADEMKPLGGAELACRLGAVSADHLLNVSEEGMRRLAGSETVATLLPATAFCLAMPYAPARRLIDMGCAVALASDYNPGSCFTNSIPLILALACIHMGMTAEEALTAMTLNGAAALGMAAQTGSVEAGKRADLLLLRFPSYRFLVYHTARDIVDTVVCGGAVVRGGGAPA